MDSVGVPKKVNRYILKCLSHFNEQRKKPKLAQIVAFVKDCNKNRVPITNIRHAVLTSLQYLERSGLINQKRNSYAINSTQLKKINGTSNDNKNANNKKGANKKTEKKSCTSQAKSSSYDKLSANNSKSNSYDTAISRMDAFRNIINSLLCRNEQSQLKNESRQQSRPHRKEESLRKEGNVKRLKRKRITSPRREFPAKRLRKAVKDRLTENMRRKPTRSSTRYNRHYNLKNLSDSNTSWQTTTSPDTTEYLSDDDIGNNLIPTDSVELRRQCNENVDEEQTKITEIQDEETKQTEDVGTNEDENKEGQDESNATESK